MSLTIDLIEAKGTLLFIAGTCLADIAVGDTFSVVFEDGKKAKSRQQRGIINLTIESIIIDGEPAENATAGESVLVALDGTWDALTTAANTLSWKSKSGRLIRTSNNGLTLSNLD
ncbi:MAG: hypothetical protein Q9P01_20785 [Anaerolineae bacterium]|nr:hypothetical protein [Anaerolineae bacterium]MDQ7037185.1 hypothetical protein [Anaerolineae bacterium]